MVETRQRTLRLGEPFLGSQPELFKVIRLARVGEDDDGIRFKMLGAVEHRREVGGGVVGGAVRLANDKRLCLETWMLGVEDDERALRFCGELGGGQLRVNLREFVVVKTFPELVVEMDIE